MTFRSNNCLFKNLAKFLLFLDSPEFELIALLLFQMDFWSPAALLKNLSPAAAAAATYTIQVELRPIWARAISDANALNRP
jgi:hypothetical protein